MRLLLSLCVAALATSASAAASTGYLYHYSPATFSQSPERIEADGETAGYILASVLQVDDYHSLKSPSMKTLAAINAFGSTGPIFGNQESARPVAVLHSIGNSLQTNEAASRTLIITSMPSIAKAVEFLSALHVQVTGGRQEDRAAAAEILRGDGDLRTDSTLIKSTASEGAHALVDKLISKGYEVFVLAQPAQTSGNHAFGPYTLPSTTSILSRRQAAEAPLEEDFRFTQTNHTDPSLQQTASNTSSSPLRGILPFCYTSKSSCESTTRNCTGHGSCKLAYTQRAKTGAEDGTPCYQCQCVPSVRGSGRAKKTTAWGGPACQKKDVTTPFWLLAGFSVFMVFLVSWAVGTIMTMGDEELPSVIGAGVSGVPRK